MFRLDYSERARESMRTYIRMLEDVHIKRFQDSGLWCEDIIIADYREKARQLFFSLENHTLRRLSTETVLGYRPDQNRDGYATLITTVDGYTIIVDYSKIRSDSREL